MYVENRQFSHPPPVYLTPPMKGFPLEFGIGVRGPKCLNDGPTRWSKKFSDRFSRFDRIPAVTDSHPASHVAVAIRLYAKASSLKSKLQYGTSHRCLHQKEPQYLLNHCSFVSEMATRQHRHSVTHQQLLIPLTAISPSLAYLSLPWPAQRPGTLHPMTCY